MCLAFFWHFLTSFGIFSDFQSGNSDLNLSWRQRWTKIGFWTPWRRSPHVFCGCGVQKGSSSAEDQFVFFLIFFAHLRLVVASIFLAKFHGGFALLTQHWAFLWSKVCFCISCCSVYAKSNTILDIQTEAPRPTRLVALQSFSDTHTGHVVLQPVQGFNEAVCRLQLNNTLAPIRG